MIDLTNLEEIAKIDPANTYKTTSLANEQAKAAWEQVKALPIQPLKEKVSSVVFCGMGASIYGALVLKALFADKLPFPIETVSDYLIPSYADKNTLVVLTSYSGTTEEVLSCANEAKERNANILVLTKGGPLAQFAKDNNIPAYIFDGKLNLSSTPRLGNGYTIIGLLGLFNKLGLVHITDKEMIDSFAYLDTQLEDIKSEGLKESEIFMNKIPIVIAAEHLSGNAQILRNQFNETSKAFSALYLVPDLNHHLMEGLQFPKESKLYFLILNSHHYSPKIAKRMELTVDVIKKNGHEVLNSFPQGKNKMEEFLETLTFGSWLTLFLGLRYNQDPSINPWVDWFKKELSK
ncbi:MAG TPA: SIS domain-containing protein [Candidatus Eisenbacteria bacterium]|nr:SIS domain-containing protein [Candidatus Eisenbacteria bacterium]